MSNLKTYLLLTLVSMLVLTGCKTRLHEVKQTRSDSTVVTLREVEKIVRIPSDTVFLTMPVFFRDSLPVPAIQIARSNRATLKVELTKSGTIEATATCIELEVKLKVMESTIEHFHTRETTYLQRESYFTELIKKLKTGIVLLIVFFIVLIAIRFINPLKQIFKL